MPLNMPSSLCPDGVDAIVNRLRRDYLYVLHITTKGYQLAAGRGRTLRGIPCNPLPVMLVDDAENMLVDDADNLLYTE